MQFKCILTNVLLRSAEDEEEYEMDPEAPYQRPASEWREDEEDDEEDGLQMKPCTKNKK